MRGAARRCMQVPRCTAARMYTKRGLNVMVNVGWIGLGKMGAPMARNLAKAGYRVKAYNRSNRSSDIGPCERVGSPAEAARDADMLFLMLSDADAIRTVLFDAEGAANALKKGALIVNMSTIGVDETKAFALEFAGRGIEWMDAPVSGSVQPAEQGTLVVLAGGSEAAFNRAHPLLETMAKDVFHIGDVGAGAAMKLCVNAFLGMTLQAVSECMAVADKTGIGREQFLNVLSTTSTWSPLLSAKRSSFVEGSYPASFSLKHMVKDLGLMAHQVAEVTATAPALFATYATFLSALANGLAEEDMAAIAAHVAKLGGSA